MVWVRVTNGIVLEVIRQDKLPPFHPDIAAQFRKAPADVAEGWLFDGGVFSPPPEPEPEPSLVEELAGMLEQLPLQVQAQVAPYALAVRAALAAGKVDLAKAIIDVIPSPPGQDLGPVKEEVKDKIDDRIPPTGGKPQ